MKICPKCGKSYTDESLNFCLDDGALLDRASSNSVLPETVLISQPQKPGGQTPFAVPSPNQNRDFPARINSSPKKGSKTWLWVVGIFGAVILICGGGLTGLFMLGKMSDNKNERNVNFGNTTYNSNSKININAIKTNTNSVKTDNNSDVEKIDLSAWVRESSQYGKTEFRGNELIVNAKQNNFYYVLVAPATYKSANSTTKLSLRDVESNSNSLGSGLIINSNPVPLIKDYAFLINAKTGKYRIVTHTPGNEKTIVNWKVSSSIKTGSQENVLEVQDANGQFKFFINGVLMETLSSKDSYQDGVPGIYVGGASPVAFTNLEIRK